MRERGCVSVMLVTDHYRGEPQGERERVCECYAITDQYRGEPQGERERVCECYACN